MMENRKHRTWGRDRRQSEWRQEIRGPWRPIRDLLESNGGHKITRERWWTLDKEGAMVNIR